MPVHCVAAVIEAVDFEVSRAVIPMAAGGWVRLRIPFTDYPGRSVYHCHVLDHEDHGMMATVNVHS